MCVSATAAVAQFSNYNRFTCSVHVLFVCRLFAATTKNFHAQAARERADSAVCRSVTSNTSAVGIRGIRVKLLLVYCLLSTIGQLYARRQTNGQRKYRFPDYHTGAIVHSLNGTTCRQRITLELRDTDSCVRCGAVARISMVHRSGLIGVQILLVRPLRSTDTGEHFTAKQAIVLHSITRPQPELREPSTYACWRACVPACNIQ